MKKFSRTYINVATAMLLCFVLSALSVMGQKTEVTSVTAPANDCKMLRDFFLDSLIKADRPGGMVTSQPYCQGNVTFFKSSEENLSLVEKLNLITGLNSNYNWLDDQNVINLSPVGFNPVLLNTRIGSLQVDDINNLTLIIDEILQSPEVAKSIVKLDIKEEMQFGGLSSPPSKRPLIKMTFKDQTVRQILNEIVRKRGRGVWSYSESSSGRGKTFSLDFSVR